MRAGRPIRAANRWVGLTCALTLGLSGCRHKATLPVLPAVTQPVDLVKQTAHSSGEPLIEYVDVRLPPVPMASKGGYPRNGRRRKSSPAVAAQVPAQTVDPPETPAPTSAELTAIGALSSGGDPNSHAQQEAADLIGSNDKRINAMPAQKAEAEKTQISKVRNFQRQAQEALTSGDIEGAKTLATKAKLLLDDVEK